jgi:hypothetical protein
MSTAGNLGRLGAAGFSTLWRGFAGALLCYLCAGIVSWIAYAVIWFINGDTTHWLREISADLLGGAAGAYMGVWVLEHTLKRYPGRTIAWIYCSVWAIAVAMILIRLSNALFKFFPGYGWEDVFTDQIEFHQTVSGLAESAVFYHYLIRPNLNLMRDHQSVLSS